MVDGRHFSKSTHGYLSLQLYETFLSFLLYSFRLTLLPYMPDTYIGSVCYHHYRTDAATKHQCNFTNIQLYPPSRHAFKYQRHTSVPPHYPHGHPCMYQHHTLYRQRNLCPAYVLHLLRIPEHFTVVGRSWTRLAT